MSTPGVSVIMPLFNTRRYVEEAVESILSQTFRDFEFIIVDNGSTDGSLEYAMSLRDSRVRVMSETARGAGNATNTGIRASKAPLLAIMDSDDVAHPHRLQVEVDFMEANPEAVLVGTRFAFRVGSRCIDSPPQPREHDQIMEALRSGRPVICNPSLMARTWAARAVGGIRHPGDGADFDFFLRMSEVGKLYNLPELLHYYRLHDESTSVVRMLEVNRVKAYALECAAARAGAEAEPPEAEFNRRWSQRPPRERAREHADCKALMLYRKANMLRAQNRRLRAAAALAHAALLNPTRTLWHVKRRFGLC